MDLHVTYSMRDYNSFSPFGSYVSFIPYVLFIQDWRVTNLHNAEWGKKLIFFAWKLQKYFSWLHYTFKIWICQIHISNVICIYLWCSSQSQGYGSVWPTQRPKAQTCLPSKYNLQNANRKYQFLGFKAAVSFHFNFSYNISVWCGESQPWQVHSAQCSAGASGPPSQVRE